MKVISIIIINGEEVEFDSLSAEEKTEISNELNRRSLATLGYQQIKTA